MSATPRTDAAQFRSDMDNYGQTCQLVRADFAKELETELTDMTSLARRLLARLHKFEGDDSGELEGIELKEEAQAKLS
jgi:hypothetical protein